MASLYVEYFRIENALKKTSKEHMMDLAEDVLDMAGKLMVNGELKWIEKPEPRLVERLEALLRLMKQTREMM